MRGDSKGKAHFPVGCGPGVLWPGPCTVCGRDGPESGCSPLGTPDFPGRKLFSACEEVRFCKI